MGKPELFDPITNTNSKVTELPGMGDGMPILWDGKYNSSKFLEFFRFVKNKYSFIHH